MNQIYYNDDNVDDVNEQCTWPCSYNIVMSITLVVLIVLIVVYIMIIFIIYFGNKYSIYLLFDILPSKYHYHE